MDRKVQEIYKKQIENTVFINYTYNQYSYYIL